MTKLTLQMLFKDPRRTAHRHHYTTTFSCGEPYNNVRDQIRISFLDTVACLHCVNIRIRTYVKHFGASNSWWLWVSQFYAGGNMKTGCVILL